MTFFGSLLILPVAAVAYFVVGLFFSVAPLPPLWTQPWKTRAILMAMKMSGTLASMGGSVGMNTIKIARFTFDRIHPRFFSRSHLNRTVITQDTVMSNVKVRIYQKRTLHESERPGLIYIHGGGFVFGSIAHSDGFVKRLVRDLDCIGVSIGYRLSPEHTYPTALADCLSVLRYVMRNAGELGIDASRVVIAGEGTGGALCAAALLKLIDDNFSPVPKLQVLLYPATQALDLQTPSYQAFKHGPLLTQNGMAFNYTLYADGSTKNMADVRANRHVDKATILEARAKYMPHSALKDIDGGEESLEMWKEEESPESSELWQEISYMIGHQYFSPLLAPDLSKMPASYVAVSKQDVLRDDGVWFGERLTKSGVTCKMDLLDCVHGWSLFSEDISSANEATEKVVGFIKEKL